MSDPHDRGELERAKRTTEIVLQLMMKAGWISNIGATSEGIGIVWTDDGRKAAEVLKYFFQALGGGRELSGEELAAVLAIIETMA